MLASRVRQHGHRWRAVAESWPHGTRTPAQCRLRWKRIRDAQGGSEAGSEAGDSCASLEPSRLVEEAVLPSWDSVPRWRRPIAGLANGEHILAARYAPVRMAALELVALPANVRTLWCRRSWPQTIYSLLRADGQLGEAPTPCRPRYRGIDRRVHRVFAAESDARRRACLRWLAPHDVLYSDAATAGSRQVPVDVLDWTPPCKCFSQAAVLASRTGDRRLQRPWERRRAAQKVMHRAGIALVRCIRRVAPRLVLCEQVAGLSTHHRRHSRLLLRRLMAAVPYAWFTVVADAANYGAPHHRVREGTAGVRLDSLAAPPPAGSVGARWWCSPCAGERRICKCRTPLRSWAKGPRAGTMATADAGCVMQ